MASGRWNIDIAGDSNDDSGERLQREVSSLSSTASSIEILAWLYGLAGVAGAVVLALQTSTTDGIDATATHPYIGLAVGAGAGVLVTAAILLGLSKIMATLGAYIAHTTEA